MTELASFADLLKTGGLTFLTAALALGAYRRWFVLGWVYDAMVKEKDAQLAAMGRERDGWKLIAERGTQDAKAVIEWAMKLSREDDP